MTIRPVLTRLVTGLLLPALVVLAGCTDAVAATPTSAAPATTAGPVTTTPPGTTATTATPLPAPAPVTGLTDAPDFGPWPTTEPDPGPRCCGSPVGG
ncbi:MAG: hypothetical protein QOG43_3201 [Actinomycetota bacterium]|nr:hypothetical protein [Actinomycetota bacterium]